MSQPAWRRYERFHHEDVDADLDDEFSAHLSLLVDQHLAEGLAPQDAESAARAAFVNATSAMEECRRLSVGRLARERRIARRARFEADVQHLVREALARPAAAIMLMGGVAVVVAASTLLLVLLLQISS